MVLTKLSTIKSAKIAAIYSNRITFSQKFREINEFQIDIAIWRNFGSINSTFPHTLWKNENTLDTVW